MWNGLGEYSDERPTRLFWEKKKKQKKKKLNLSSADFALRM